MHCYINNSCLWEKWWVREQSKLFPMPPSIFNNGSTCHLVLAECSVWNIQIHLTANTGVALVLSVFQPHNLFWRRGSRIRNLLVYICLPSRSTMDLTSPPTAVVQSPLTSPPLPNPISPTFMTSPSSLTSHSSLTSPGLSTDSPHMAVAQQLG